MTLTPKEQARRKMITEVNDLNAKIEALETTRNQIIADYMKDMGLTYSQIQNILLEGQ